MQIIYPQAKVFAKIKSMDDIKKEVRERTLSYIVAALGLVAGLAWNEAIKSLIEYFFPASNGLLAKFIYTIILTLIVVFVTTYLVRLPGQKKQT